MNQKQYQISIDGRAVNIKFLNEFKLKREENAFHLIIDIWICSLHSVHGFVKTLFDKSFLQGVKIMKVFQDQWSIHGISVQPVGLKIS